jgi:high-affinity Fe2+/Pb2+ permease
MKKEFGKWLMDIAKYLTTVLLLSSIFGDMDNPFVVVGVILASLATLVIGLLLVKDEKIKKEK